MATAVEKRPINAACRRKYLQIFTFRTKTTPRLLYVCIALGGLTCSGKPLIMTLFRASSHMSHELSFHTCAAMLYSSISGSCATTIHSVYENMQRAALAVTNCQPDALTLKTGNVYYCLAEIWWCHWYQTIRG